MAIRHDYFNHKVHNDLICGAALAWACLHRTEIPALCTAEEPGNSRSIYGTCNPEVYLVRNCRSMCMCETRDVCLLLVPGKFYIRRRFQPEGRFNRWPMPICEGRLPVTNVPSGRGGMRRPEKSISEMWFWIIGRQIDSDLDLAVDTECLQQLFVRVKRWNIVSNVYDIDAIFWQLWSNSI